MINVDYFISKYPKMEVQDIIKLYLQGILGPAHLMPNKDKMKINLMNEYEECKDINYNYDLFEDISEEYTRVYIKPYFEKMKSFDKLIEIFEKSIDLDLDIDAYKGQIKSLINKENEEFINRYLNSDNILISHSRVYKENYFPHYLVIKRKYKKEVLSMKSKVYFSSKITKESVLNLYKVLGYELKGNVAIKVHSGEPGNQNFLRPSFWEDIINEVGGTVVECNTAYEGRRNTTEKHKLTFVEHGWNAFKVDLLDAEGPDLVLDIPNGKVIKKNYVGKNLASYDSMLVLSHFKGHPMGGYGGAIKQLSIGVASSYGKAYIHGAGDPKKIWTADHNLFLESMADAASSVVSYFKGNIVYINVMKNMSVDCDCCAVAEDPCIKDIGILISLDPIAIDQACIDLVYNSDDEKKEHLIQRIESRNGILTIEASAKLGFGSREYELIKID